MERTVRELTRCRLRARLFEERYDDGVERRIDALDACNGLIHQLEGCHRTPSHQTGLLGRVQARYLVIHRCAPSWACATSGSAASTRSEGVRLRTTVRRSLRGRRAALESAGPIRDVRPVVPHV